MKASTALILITLFLGLRTQAQSGEFVVHENGLIYDEQTMTQLSGIVDSLNLKFKTCDLDRTFYSKQQAVGYLIEISTGDFDAVKNDLQDNIPFETFIAKYPEAEVEHDVLILRNRYRDYYGTEKVVIEHFDLKSDYGFRITSEDLSLLEKNLEGKWLYEYWEESDYYSEKIKAFYFPTNFQTYELPQQYALMIGYSDCLIDTATTKLKDDLEGNWNSMPKNWRSFSIGKKEKLLDELRSTRVVGMCSQDSRPREHAMYIALLSAETANWEVFLRAHLDIMNDRFSRVTDGSYAWGARQTYIRELEELNINVLDLIFGISLRVENPAQNHYYSSIGRVGRALSETRDKEEVERQILSIIADEELDTYNRLIFYFLFRNYNHYLADDDLKAENDKELALAVRTLPDAFRDRLINN